MLSERDLEIRRAGLTSSDMVALLGLSSYRRPIDVWLEKTGQITPPRIESTAMRWGHRLEPLVAEDYAETFGVVTVEPTETLVHPDRPWHRGTPDRLVYLPEAIWGDQAPPARDFRKGMVSPVSPSTKAERGLECKSHGHFPGRDYGDGGDDVPHDKLIQCCWYMPLVGLDRWDLHALIDTNKPRTFIIERDPELEASLLEEAEFFWRHHVVGGVEPEPDGSESFKRYVAQRFTLHDAEIVDAPPDVVAIASRFREVRRVRLESEAAEELAKQQLQLAIGPHLGVAMPSGEKITWKQRRSGRLQEKDARTELYLRLGMTDDEIALFEKKYAFPDYRQINVPRTW